VTASWGWHPAVVVARRSALPVQVLPPLVGGVCGDHRARRYDDAGAGPAEAGRCDDRPRGPWRFMSSAIAVTVDRDIEVVRGLRDQWRSLARSSVGVSVPRMRIVALLATVSSRGWVGAWLC